VVILITVLVAAALPGLELQPGMPLPRLEKSQFVIPAAPEETPVVLSINKFILILFALMLGGLAIYALYRLARGVGWKQLISYLQPILISISIFSAILFVVTLLLFGPKKSSPAQLPVPMPAPLVTTALGPAPAVLLWVVAAGLLAVSGVVGIWMVRASSRRPRVLDLVGLEAQQAWQALQTGMELKDVIIQCYRRMSVALERNQGIEREDWMTTGEFENLLEAAGIPHEPIAQLTQLFEAVRYGAWQPNSKDEQKAIACLQAIMAYSHEAGNLE
jgi:hypothetical protein